MIDSVENEWLPTIRRIERREIQSPLIIEDVDLHATQHGQTESVLMAGDGEPAETELLLTIADGEIAGKSRRISHVSGLVPMAEVSEVPQ
jgi:hypothetical protein